jgi:mannan endo-1,4-beta-mannosidase
MRGLRDGDMRHETRRQSSLSPILISLTIISVMIRSRLWCGIYLLALSLCGGCRADEFVKTSGTGFEVSGHPFFVTGVNNHYLTYGTPIEVTRVLDDAVALGATVVRTFLQPVIGSPNIPTIWKWKSNADSDNLGVHGNYLLSWDDVSGKMLINEGPNGIQKVDFLIAEAKKRNLKLIIVFLDYWSFLGGAQQMLAWHHVSDSNMIFYDRHLKEDYKNWVSYVLERVNPLTSLPYKDDPTIMAWELMNEGHGDPEQFRLAWEAEMARYVKSHDANHLIGSGSANPTVRELSDDLAIPNIDFGAWHGYPIFFRVTPQQFSNLIPQFCDLARVYNKPVLLEEFGYARSHPDQADDYTKWLTMLHNNENCAGWLVWRLVSLQESGHFPVDNYDQFDIRTNETVIWNVLKAAMRPVLRVVTR